MLVFFISPLFLLLHAAAEAPPSNLTLRPAARLQFVPISRQANFNRCNVNGAIVVTVQGESFIGGVRVQEGGVPATFQPAGGGACPFGFTSLFAACRSPADCGGAFGAQCIGGSCCALQQTGGQLGGCPNGAPASPSVNGRFCSFPTDCYAGFQCVGGTCCSSAIGQPGGQCGNGGQPLGRGCSTANQCTYSTPQGVVLGQCWAGACCTVPNNGQLQQCANGGVPQGRSCNVHADCFSGYQCAGGQCCSGGAPQPGGQCANGGQPMGLPFCGSDFQCVDSFTGVQRQGRCLQGVCCTQNSLSTCPFGQQPLGRSCQSDATCGYADPATGGFAQGQCVQQTCCSRSQTAGQCAQLGLQPLGRACGSTGAAECTYYEGVQFRNGVCFQGQCCRQAGGTGGCSGGRVDVGFSCTLSQECQTFTDRSAVCENGRCCRDASSGGCLAGERIVTERSCAFGQPQTCFALGDTCRNGVCCTRNAQSDTCPPNSQPLGRACSGFAAGECAFQQANGLAAQGVCVGGRCCTAGSSAGDSCAAFGLVPTGEFCSANLQACRSPTGANVQCVGGRCCSAQLPGGSASGFCYDGRPAQRSCRRAADCPSGNSCMNGLCCPTTGNEWKFACAGITAVASCFTDGTCGRGMRCTTSNYCCECDFGRSSGQCAHGCPPGYQCSSNGFCCPQCPNGQPPVGSCYNNQCAAGLQCASGNICCSAQSWIGG
ncbi:hypothetical protein M3Y99_01150600 [Aphelenchoides fujianensis]|nr:hypothetical protein M3Y99_01150600 [Aphelenchoides fujianensis]